MRITLGVTGGVAAYKSAELVRRLQTEGHSVQVVMTRAAREFITPLTFAALSGQKVITDLFSDSNAGDANLESAIEHIAVAQRTDLLLVAPATADIAGEVCARARGRFSFDVVSGFDGASGAGSRDEREYVAASGDAGESGDAAEARRARSWSLGKATWHAG